MHRSRVGTVAAFLALVSALVVADAGPAEAATTRVACPTDDLAAAIAVGEPGGHAGHHRHVHRQLRRGQGPHAPREVRRHA